MAFMVLFSSIGLTLNAHYCHTTGAFKKSILPIELHCNDMESSHSCTLPYSENASEAACCAAEARQAEQNHDEECCEDFTTYLKLLSEFDISTFKAGFNLFLSFMLAVLDFLLPSADRDLGTNSELNDPPSVLFGKQLLLTFKQLKIAPATL